VTANFDLNDFVVIIYNCFNNALVLKNTKWLFNTIIGFKLAKSLWWFLTFFTF